MRPGWLTDLGSALAWFLFPIVPALLGTTYRQQLYGGFGTRGGPDPRDWDLGTWILMTGPLLGYGFLAGTTIDLPDDPGRRGIRGWLSRRSLWVAVGPWLGFLAWVGIYQSIQFLNWAYPPSREWRGPSLPAHWQDTWKSWLIFYTVLIVPLAYGWLFVAWAALRRARRLRQLRRSLVRGLALAIGFVGSLFGSFWTVTEAWRGYFFDPRIVPTLIAAVTLALMTGCAAPETLGEIRRRELFQAMLMAWLLGLALAWRWWSRSRSKPSGPS